MKNKGPIGALILIAYCIGIFIVSLVVISKIMNQGNVDMTTEMSDATFPVISFTAGDIEYNTLHGYGKPMEVAHIRDSVTVMGSDRKLSFKIDNYEATIAGISFELRNEDGSRLIEESDVHDYIRGDGYVTGTITFKDLIYDHTEYTLIVNVETSRGQNIHYYTKLIEADDYHLEEMVDFATSFSAATFDKTRAQMEITTYVESNEEGDNTTFNNVDIHCSLDQITWGDLIPAKVVEPSIVVSQIDDSVGVIHLSYFVSTGTAKKEFYRVDEMYRMRLGEERMYLLDYNRTMNQIFQAKTDNIVSNKIELGIVDSNINMVESADGRKIAFVNDGRLFSYNVTDNKLANIFSFYDDVYDVRETYNNHDIKIFNIDDSGNIYFMVYGYMNKGGHEGEMGCMVDYYDSATNSVEELIFLPSNQPYDALVDEVKELSYVDANKNFYVLVGNHVYKIDIENDEYEDIASFSDSDSFAVSTDSSMFAWVGDGYSNSTELNWLNMETNETLSIEAPRGDLIRPVGFFGDDLIYGLAHKSDITTDKSGMGVFPMYELYIIDNKLTTIKTYEGNGSYVTDFRADGKYMINLNRMKKDESGRVCVKDIDDQLIDNSAAIAMKNTVNIAAIEKYEKVVELAFNREVDSDKTQILTPKFVLFEGDREVDIDHVEYEGIYYTYVKGQYKGTYDNPSEAVSFAYDNGGCVYDQRGNIVYRKTTLSKKNQIMAITGKGLNEGEENFLSTAVCLNSILEYEGVKKETRNMVRKGTAPQKILEDSLENYEILNLSGCPLESVLSYVEKDIPVLVLLNDGTAYLLVGYNEFNTVVMNPLTGTVYKIGMNDSRDFFQENGNRFITYLRNEN